MTIPARHPRPIVLLLTVLVLLAAGCAGAVSGAGGSGSATATPASEPTGEPTPTEGVIPTEAADAHEEALLALEAARADWAAVGMDTYTYELRRQCFCPPEFTGPWTIEVVDGQVESVADAQGAPVPVTGGPVEFGPVESVHDAIEGMLTGDPASTTPSGTYDAQGLPDGVYVDPDPTMADEEATWTARLVDEAAADAAAGGGAASDGSTIEPVSESAALATGQPVSSHEDLIAAFTAQTQCGPADEVLGITLNGTFRTDESLDDAVTRLTDAGLDAVRGEDDVIARGTTAVGAPIVIHIQDGEAVVTLELEQLPGGYEAIPSTTCG